MAQLVWRPEAGGYAANGYRIRHIAGQGRYHWRLEVRTGLGGGDATEWATVSYHGSLRGAHHRADSIEHEQLRRDRTLVRVAAGTSMLAVFLTAAVMPSSLAQFAIMVAGLGLAVASLASALAVYAGEASQWARGLTTTMTWLDRMAAPLLRGLRRRTARPPAAGEPEPVRVLPPQPPMLRGGT